MGTNGQTEFAAFVSCRQALLSRVRLAHRDHRIRSCFYVDASDTQWAGMETQIPKADADVPQHSKRHKNLAFLSGKFNDTQFCWYTFEEEAYSVMESSLVASSADTFDLFTDYSNVIFIFDSAA